MFSWSWGWSRCFDNLIYLSDCVVGGRWGAENIQWRKLVCKRRIKQVVEKSRDRRRLSEREEGTKRFFRFYLEWVWMSSRFFQCGVLVLFRQFWVTIIGFKSWFCVDLLWEFRQVSFLCVFYFFVEWLILWVNLKGVFR